MENTKEHILRVATRLFLEKSFKEVTMKEIVEKTGMSKGAFYHYFASKDQLFLEIAENFLSAVQTDYDKLSQASLFEFYHQYLERMSNLLPALEDWLGDWNNANNLNFFMMLFDAIKRYPGYRDELREMHKIELGAWKKVIDLARKKGEIQSPMTDEQIAKIFVYMIDALSLHNVLDGYTIIIKDEIEQLFDNFYKQLKA
jgi:TetR/AcrR family transcriptional regulator, transcriptional repressor for nem operon